MDVIIQSTKSFEKDISQLSEQERELVIQKLNLCAQLFVANHHSALYRKMIRPHPLHLVQGYESSLYALRISRKLRVILAIDEDPIFGEGKFTLFRAIKTEELERAYNSVAESLYQDLLVQERQNVQTI